MCVCYCDFCPRMLLTFYQFKIRTDQNDCPIENQKTIFDLTMSFHSNKCVGSLKSLCKNVA